MSVRELSAPPGRAALYPRAVAGGARAAVRRLPGLGRGEAELPDLELVLDRTEIDRERLADYDRVCGFRLRDELPPTYPHLLAFPLALRIMTDGSFPFSALGLVHVRNRIEQRRPIDAADRLTVRVRAADLRPHDRGRQFDRNPIHLHPLTAKLFGFPRAVAHGMWLKARCLAALEGRLPGSFTVDVRFQRPALLPGKVAFSTRADGFALHDPKTGAPHLTGTIA